MFPAPPVKYTLTNFLLLTFYFSVFFSYYKYKDLNGKDDIKELVYEDSRSNLATDG